MKMKLVYGIMLIIISWFMFIMKEFRLGSCFSAMGGMLIVMTQDEL